MPTVSDRTPGPWVVVKIYYRPWWKWWGPKATERTVSKYWTLGPAEYHAAAFGGSVRKAKTEEGPQQHPIGD